MESSVGDKFSPSGGVNLSLQSLERGTGFPGAPKARPKRQLTKGTKTHPSYPQMVKEAIVALKDRKGCSRVAILKYIAARYHLDLNAKRIHSQLRVTIKKGIESGKIALVKGTGVNGSFKLGVLKKDKAEGKLRKPKKKTMKQGGKARATAAPKKPRPKKISAIKKSPKKPKRSVKTKKLNPKVSKPKKVTS